MFRKISFWLTDKISDKEDTNYYLYQFAIEGLMHTFIHISIAVILSLIFGYFPYVLLGILLIDVIARYSGSCHGRTELECLLLTELSFSIVGISAIILNKYYILFFIISLISLQSIKVVPKYTKQAVQHSLEKQKNFKRKYQYILYGYIIINLIFCILTLFSMIDVSKISIMISMSLLVNDLFLTDFMFHILDN